MSPSLRRAARRVLPFAAALLVLALGAATRGADDPLAWSNGPELWRYVLEETRDPKVARTPGYWPDGYVDTFRLVRGSELENRKQVRGDPQTLGELVWQLALSLPDRDPGARGQPVKRVVMFGSLGGELALEGREEARTKDGVIELKVSLSMTPTGRTPSSYYRLADGATLVVERRFDPKTRTVLDARYDVSVKQELGANPPAGATAPPPFHGQGRIVAKGKAAIGTREALLEVQAAIKRGAAALKTKLATQLGSYKATKPQQGTQALGNVALSVLALLRSGVPQDELKDAFDFMASCELSEVYSVALYLMCQEARAIRRIEVEPEPEGRTVARFRKEPVPDAVRKEMARAAEWLLAARARGAWSYGAAAGAGGDRSNSQFAILALHCAAVSNIQIPPEVWSEVVEELLAAQEREGPLQTLKGTTWSEAAPWFAGQKPGKDSGGASRSRPASPLTKTDEAAKARGWTYGMRTACPAGKAYGSMSGAGLSSFAIAREGLRRAGRLDPETEAQSRRAILDGVAWFALEWTPSRNPHMHSSGWFHYYLYSVEKAMETTGVELVGGRDWWGEGCAQLLGTELTDKSGSWGFPPQGSPNETAFALLFLNRATLPARLVVSDKVKIASGDKDGAWDLVKVEGTGFVRLEQVLEVLEAGGEGTREAQKIAEKGIHDLPEVHRPRLAGQLLRLLASPDKAVKKFAQTTLKAVTGGLDDEPRVRTFWERYELVRKTALEKEPRLEAVREVYGAAGATFPLKRHAAEALARLRAVEAVPDAIADLQHPNLEVRKLAWSLLAGLAGGEHRPFDPAGPEPQRAKQQTEWRAWWETSGTELVAAQGARRAVERLGDPARAAAAEARLKELGRAAIPALIDGLDDAAARPRIHALLKELTKQSLPADRAAWRAWWEKEKR